MPNGDPLDRFFYPTLTLMIDFYAVPITTATDKIFGDIFVLPAKHGGHKGVMLSAVAMASYFLCLINIF